MDDNEKVLRANRGLGALLNQMGGGAAGAQGNLPPPPPVVRKDKVPKLEMTEDQGFDLSSEGFCGWGDLSDMTNSDNTKVKSMPYAKQPTKQGMLDERPATRSKREAPPKAMEGDSKKPRYDYDEDVYGPRDVTKWSDVPEYNEAHDQGFFKEENEKMAKKYGEGIISATYIENQPGKVGYYCKICYAEMNSENTLGLHCSGMKHLKKKNLLEKSKGNQSAGYSELNNEDPDSQNGIRAKKGRGGEAGRDRGGESRRGRSEARRDKDEARRDRGEAERSRGGGETGRGRDRGETGRGRDGGETGRGQGRGDLDQRKPRDYDDYYKHDRDNDDHYNRPSADSRGRYDRAQDDYYRRPEPVDRRGSPYVDRRRYDDHYYDRGGHRDQYSHDRHSSERYPHDRYGSSGPPPPAPYIGSLEDHTMPPDPPTKPQENMSGGTSSTLLSKLAACSVKSGDDAHLATNVIVLLMKSLKEYNQKKGSSNSVHLLDDIAVKINIMKTLKDKEYRPPKSASISQMEPPPPPSIKDHFSNWKAQPNQSYAYRPTTSRW